MAQCCNNSATKPDERSGESDHILEKLVLFHSCIQTSRAFFQDIPAGEGRGKVYYYVGLVNLNLLAGTVGEHQQ